MQSRKGRVRPNAPYKIFLTANQLVWFLAPTGQYPLDCQIQHDADNSLVALCQQHSVSFSVNLPAYQLRVLSGEDEVDRWTNQTIWDAALKNIRIVISSYAVLLDALSHGFVTMERLALCIFDEGMFRKGGVETG